MSNDDLEYYRARVLDERAKAEAADQQNVRQIHLDLASHYQALVDQTEPRRRLSIGWGNMPQG
jgi:hypothetical protein